MPTAYYASFRLSFNSSAKGYLKAIAIHENLPKLLGMVAQSYKRVELDALRIPIVLSRAKKWENLQYE